MRRLSSIAGVLSLVLGLCPMNSRGQSASDPSTGVISRGTTNNIESASTNEAVDNPASTNRSSFSVEQLRSELQNLRTVVDQTLPLLSAFNERYSASQPGTTLGRAIQNIFSGTKGENGSRAGEELTNVLSALGALVSTNQTGNATVNPNTFRDFVALQKNLQQVQDVMRNLSLTGQTNQASGGNVPTPTGR